MIALAVGPAAVLARIVRVEMLSVLDADYVRTARAKRLPRWRIYFSHALPNAVTATLTLAGLILSSLVIGTVFVESVFAWPGLGSTIVGAIQMKDYPAGTGDRPRLRSTGPHHQHDHRLGPRSARPPHDAGGQLMRAFARILRTPLGIAAVTLMALVMLTAIFAPIIWGTEADVVDTDNLLAPPSAEHPIGTDHLGRDLLMRVLVATRLSLVLALLATFVSVTAGMILGMAPYLLGRAGRAVTWLVGIAVAFPGLLLALFLAIIFGAGWTGAVLAIGLAGAPSFARLCQTLVASVTERDYVAAARIGGIGRFRILTRHIFPNIGEPLIVNATIGAGGALLAFAGLSFIGIGVQPPEYDWGRLMMEGLPRIYINPLAAIAPGIAVVIAGLAFNLVGEAAARALGIESAGVAAKLKKRRPAADARAVGHARRRTRSCSTS